MSPLTQDCYNAAIKALKKCTTKHGLFASGTPEGYRSLWARDSIISLLGGSLIGTKFKSVFKISLTNLAKNQAPNGQIPNAIGIYDPNYRSKVTYNTIDSSLWFIIGAHVYEKAYREKLPQKIKIAVEKAFIWVTYQDVSEEHLPAQLPTTDWQDAFPHKYGHTINTEALYYAALQMMGKTKEAKIVKDLVGGNRRPHLKLWDEGRGYFLPWAWKDHDGDREEEQWFDSLGNLLAIVTGLATPAQAKRILNCIEREKINRPYPIKSIWPPIKPESKLWKSYFSKADSRKPFDYLNGGIWPFIGGFYVAALVKAKQFKKAKVELERLALANRSPSEASGEGGQNTPGEIRVNQFSHQRKSVSPFEFNEWLSGKTGEPKGGILQAWSIGMFLYAYKCVRNKQVPFLS